MTVDQPGTPNPVPEATVSEARGRLPARLLVDVALSEEAFRADFEITDKYQAFSAELVRLALLGSPPRRA